MNKRKITNIKLYSTLTCPYCKMEKAWLDEKKINHEVVLVDLNPKEAAWYKELGKWVFRSRKSNLQTQIPNTSSVLMFGDSRRY